MEVNVPYAFHIREDGKVDVHGGLFHALSDFDGLHLEDANGGHHIVSHYPLLVHPHGIKPAGNFYQHNRSRIAVQIYWLPCVGDSRFDMEVLRVHFRYLSACYQPDQRSSRLLCQIAVHTKRYSDDGFINSGVLYDHAWKDFDSSP